ncbi:hypothetical protein HN51_022220 [Arachis hypogaea]
MELCKAFLAFVLILVLSLLYGGVKALSRRDYSLVEKSERRPLVVSEYGTVSAVDVQAGHGAYSKVNELIKGFDKRIIQAAFKVLEDLVEVITKKSNIPGIVHSKNATSEEQYTPEIDLEASLHVNILGIHSSNKEKTKYNIFKHDPDFRNRHGWTLPVTKKQLKALKHTNLRFLMSPSLPLNFLTFDEHQMQISITFVMLVEQVLWFKRQRACQWR